MISLVHPVPSRHDASTHNWTGNLTPAGSPLEKLPSRYASDLPGSKSDLVRSVGSADFGLKLATNTCLNDLRRPAGKAEVLEAKVNEDEPSVFDTDADVSTPLHALEAKELEAAVAKAMKKMSERERAAFAMCRFEGMAYRDIADALEATESAVKSLIHRATVQVMKHLSALSPEGSAS